ncbi:hypothetical protein KY338_05225 [Candidatus Woesearchaeota archaeon]|nr:hypothetical protein [Candidatus Woesearchaeota archaeon]MBW3005552.1 hypothetical protein [Candidatus Woesearchaeota archaeon]
MNIKKIVALGVGLTMVGATVFGASAWSLADYPAPFVKDGLPDPNLAIVIGDQADGSDVVGAMDVQGNLQQEAKVVVKTTTPAVGGVVVTGDAAEVGSTSDLLEINETIGDVRETFTEVDLDMLKGGQIVTNRGSTEYNQYLRFPVLTAGVYPPSGAVIFDEDERDKVGHYLYWRANRQLYQWELEFEEGLRSRISPATLAAPGPYDLEDLEDKDLFMLGQPFVVVDTDLFTPVAPNNLTSLTIDLMGGAVAGILGENDKETYVVDGKEYEVEVLVISETSANGEGSVKFRVNGEITSELRDGETDVLADGTQIGIRDILATGKDIQKSIVQFYIGAYKVSFTDRNTTDTLFEQSGTEVNEETIEDSNISIRGSLTGFGNEYELTSVRYNLQADAVLGDVYIPPGTGLREQLDEPEGMLTPFWDIRYEGLMDTGVTIVRWDARGSREYDLEFTNQEGIMYDTPLISNKGANFYWGDDDDRLWFTEGSNNATPTSWPIARRDYFILSDCLVTPYNTAIAGNNDNTCFTHVLRYNSIDTANRRLTFTDLATGTRETTYDAITCQANLVVGGVTYLVEVDPTGAACGATTTDLVIDLNANAVAGAQFTRGEQVLVALQGEGLLHFNTSECVRGAANRPSAGVPTWDWLNCTVNNTNATMELITLAKEFDEAQFDESVNVTIEARANNRIGLKGNTPSGITDLVWRRTTFFGPFDLEENEDLEHAMTGYGVFLEVYRPQSSTQAEDLTAEYPLSQRGARVFVTGGQVSVADVVGGGTSEQIQPIQLGTAKLASEIADITQWNAIVVGGPCANPIAAQLMGNPDPCWESIPENKAIVKLYTHANGRVALLVAGRTAKNTRQGCRAVATGQVTSVAGTSAMVSGTSLTDTTVTEM